MRSRSPRSSSAPWRRWCAGRRWLGRQGDRRARAATLGLEARASCCEWVSRRHRCAGLWSVHDRSVVPAIPENGSQHSWSTARAAKDRDESHRPKRRNSGVAGFEPALLAVAQVEGSNVVAMRGGPRSLIRGRAYRDTRIRLARLERSRSRMRSAAIFLIGEGKTVAARRLADYRGSLGPLCADR
jgi:hypothetical protein